MGQGYAKHMLETAKEESPLLGDRDEPKSIGHGWQYHMAAASTVSSIKFT